MRFEREGRVREHLHRVAGSNIFISTRLSSATGQQSSIYEELRALQLVAREYKPSLDPMEMSFFYNAVTNEFAVLSLEGVIRTYFRPVQGFEYWLRQTGRT